MAQVVCTGVLGGGVPGSPGSPGSVQSGSHGVGYSMIAWAVDTETAAIDPQHASVAARMVSNRLLRVCTVTLS